MLKISEYDTALRIVQAMLGLLALVVAVLLGAHEYALGTLDDIKPILGALVLAAWLMIVSSVSDDSSPDERA
jgi:hypothetical protein